MSNFDKHRLHFPFFATPSTIEYTAENYSLEAFLAENYREKLGQYHSASAEVSSQPENYAKTRRIFSGGILYQTSAINLEPISKLILRFYTTLSPFVNTHLLRVNRVFRKALASFKNKMSNFEIGSNFKTLLGFRAATFLQAYLNRAAPAALSQHPTKSSVSVKTDQT